MNEGQAVKKSENGSGKETLKYRNGNYTCAKHSPTLCAVLSSVCATTVDNSDVYVYYLTGTVSVCFRCPPRTVGFSGTCHYA